MTSTNKTNFKMPTKSTVKSRISTINNACALSITPYIKPSTEEVQSLYDRLNIAQCQCAYCMRRGQAKTMDHFRPVVNGKMPSGYVSDITNLVPCCNDCNSKKGGKKFEDWFVEDNQWLLDNLGSEVEIAKRKKIILNAMKPKYMDYKKILGPKDWKKFINIKDKLEKDLKEGQDVLNDLAEKILSAY